MIHAFTELSIRARLLARRTLVLILLGAVPVAACDGGTDGSVSAGSPLFPAGQQSGQPRPAGGGQIVRTAEIRIGGVPVRAEIADNAELRAKGLMNRDSLPESRGMLFVYGTAEVRSFWMRNTRIPLDIAFIDGAGVVINIEQMDPQTDQNYFSQGPMMYALEMNRGWFEAHGIGPGDRLEF